MFTISSKCCILVFNWFTEPWTDVELWIKNFLKHTKWILVAWLKNKNQSMITHSIPYMWVSYYSQTCIRQSASQVQLKYWLLKAAILWSLMQGLIKNKNVRMFSVISCFLRLLVAAMNSGKNFGWNACRFLW